MQRFQADTAFSGNAFLAAPRQLAGEGPVTKGGDAVLHVVFLEKHPARHLGAQPGIVRQIRCAVRKVHQDGIGFAQRAAILQFQYGYRTGRIPGQEFRFLPFGLEDADQDGLMGDVQVVQELAHLPGILRGEIVIQFQHRAHSGSGWTPVWPTREGRSSGILR